jgi:DNA-binding transcriptional MerR regulator
LTPYRGPGRTLAPMATFTIGQLADAAGVHLETVRYYERRGLLPAPPRTPSGYRQFGDDDLARLQLIVRAKSLGFTLAEIAELTSEAHPQAVVAAARAKLVAIAEQQQALHALRHRLERLVDACADGDDGCLALCV